MLGRLGLRYSRTRVLSLLSVLPEDGQSGRGGDFACFPSHVLTVSANPTPIVCEALKQQLGSAAAGMPCGCAGQSLPSGHRTTSGGVGGEAPPSISLLALVILLFVACSARWDVSALF